MQPVAPGQSRMKGLEAYRGISALLVVLFHTAIISAYQRNYGSAPLNGLFKAGRAGVDIFFVISGFIITYVHFADIGRPSTLWLYIGKRLWRIFPTYWIVTLALVAVMLVSAKPEGDISNLSYMARSVFLVPGTLPFLSVAWTLQYELVFYSAFSFLILHKPVGLTLFFVWFVMAATNVSVLTFTGHALIGGVARTVLFDVLDLEFFLGMGVALLLRQARAGQASNLYAMTALAAGIVLFALVAMLDAWGPAMPLDWPPKLLAYAFSAALMLYGIVRPGDAGARMGWRRAPWTALGSALGAASYSIYLTNFYLAEFFFLALRPFLRSLPMGAGFCLVVVLTIIPGIVFSTLVERPLFRWAFKPRVLPQRP